MAAHRLVKYSDSQKLPLTLSYRRVKAIYTYIANNIEERSTLVIRQAVVLAGGSGSRLRPLSDEIPKALIKLCEKPLLQWVIEWLRYNGVQHVVIGVAHLKDKVIRYFGDKN